MNLESDYLSLELSDFDKHVLNFELDLNCHGRTYVNHSEGNIITREIANFHESAKIYTRYPTPYPTLPSPDNLQMSAGEAEPRIEQFEQGLSDDDK